MSLRIRKGNLHDFAKQLSKAIDLPVVVDRSSIIALKEKFTLDLKDVRPAVALKIVEKAGPSEKLAWRKRRGVVVIVDPPYASDRLEPEIYDVRDLVDVQPGIDPPLLKAMVRYAVNSPSVLAPEARQVPSNVTLTKGMLVVRSRPAQQAEVRLFLRDLRRATAGKPVYPGRPKMLTKLKQKVRVDVVETPLRDVLDSLAEETGIEFDTSSLRPDHAYPVSGSFQKLSLATCLEHFIVRSSRLGYTLADGKVILETSPDQVRGRFFDATRARRQLGEDTLRSLVSRHFALEDSSIVLFDDILIVWQTEHGQRRIEKFLRDIDRPLAKKVD